MHRKVIDYLLQNANKHFGNKMVAAQKPAFVRLRVSLLTSFTLFKN